MNTPKVIPLLILVVLALGAVFVPEVPLAVGGAVDSGDTAWVLTATCLVLLMTPGLSFFHGGMVSRKNVISTMLQSFIALGVVSLVWVAFGFSSSRSPRSTTRSTSSPATAWAAWWGCWPRGSWPATSA